MLIDVIIVVLTVAMAVWGYSRGLSPGLLIAVAFGIGAVLGSRAAPQVLPGGLHDPFAPVLALPGALLLGAVLAAGMERARFRLRRVLRRRYAVDAFGGAVLGAFVGIVGIWVVAAAGARSDGLDRTVRESSLVDRLNAVLPPPGPVLVPEKLDSPPRLATRNAGETPEEQRVKQDPEVKAAARSVVKVTVDSCGHGGEGTGWIAGPGIVMTNAHVVHGARSIDVRIEGKGQALEAEPIYFNRDNDISVLRVPDARGQPALRIDARPKVGIPVAVQGFPFGKRFKSRGGRLGPVIAIKPEKNVTRTRPSNLLRTGFGLGPGSSGGPVVDRDGRVVGMLFAGSRVDRMRNSYAIPGREMKTTLRRALAAPRPVSAGPCHS